MKTLIVVLLVLWLAFAIIGALLEGLFWLLVIGVVAFIVTAARGGSSCAPTGDDPPERTISSAPRRSPWPAP